MGRGREVRAKVGGVSEGGKSIEEKDKDEEKGKGKTKGRMPKTVEGKGKAQESTKSEEKPNQREKEDAGDEGRPDLSGVFNLDPPRGGQRALALGSGDVNDPSALDSHSTQKNKTSQTRQNSTSLPPMHHSQPAKKP